MRTRAGVAALAAFASGLRWERVPATVRNQLRLAVIDLLGVGLAGAGTADHQRLLAVAAPAPGASRVLGTDQRGAPADAAWLNGVAACSLELDEGNKYSRGHPAVHAFPAVLAEAEVLRASGTEVCAALLAGYEVGARMGAAIRLHTGVHPHGTWGATGAAAGLARLRRLDVETTAAAIDAAAGLAFATTFSSALDGNLVRNAWVGGANEAGMRAVRLAMAGHARNDGTAAATLGTVLGDLEPDALDDGLGHRWMITRGYFKRHASCAYTHPPADAALHLRQTAGPLAPDDIAAVTVETHHVAAPLNRTFDPAPPSRLAAMFSIPWVTAVALTSGVVEPDHLGTAALRDGPVARLARRVRVVVAADLDAALPEHRGARLVVELTDGRRLTATVADPVGDADHASFGPAEVHAKLTRLLGAARAEAIAGIGDDLDRTDDVTDLLARVP